MTARDNKGQAGEVGMPLVSIVLVTWQGRKLLETYLPSLRGLQYPNYEVIIVDNASRDGSVDFLQREYPEFRVVVNETNLGTAAGSNVAIPFSRGKYIFWVSNDMLFDPGIVDHLVECCESDPDIGICTVKMRQIKNGRLTDILDSVGAAADVLAFPMPRGANQVDRGQYDQRAEVFFSMGGCLFIRKDVLSRVKGFDPEFLTLTDDIDLCWRVRLLGYKVVAEPRALLYHRVSSTLGKTHNRPQKRYLSERNTLRTLLKNYSRGYLLFILPLCLSVLTLEVFFYLVTGRWQMVRAVGRAIRWNISRRQETFSLRRSIQAGRAVPDRVITARMRKRSEKIRLFFDYLFHRDAERWNNFFS